MHEFLFLFLYFQIKYILFGEKIFYSLNLIPFIFSKTLIGQLEKKKEKTLNNNEVYNLFYDCNCICCLYYISYVCTILVAVFFTHFSLFLRFLFGFFKLNSMYGKLFNSLFLYLQICTSFLTHTLLKNYFMGKGILFLTYFLFTKSVCNILQSL